MSDPASSLPGRFRILAICGFCVVAASAAAESNPATALSSEAAAAVDRATADNAHADRGTEVAHAFLHARGGVHGEVLVFRSKERKMSCPAYEFKAGKFCWFINGTICGGTVHDNWSDKICICRECEVLSSQLAFIEKEESE